MRSCVKPDIVSEHRPHTFKLIPNSMKMVSNAATSLVNDRLNSADNRNDRVSIIKIGWTNDNKSDIPQQMSCFTLNARQEDERVRGGARS